MSLNKYLTEFIGTFFLVAAIGFAVLAPGGAGNLAPLVEALQPNVPRALLAEFLYTFALAYVILNVATAKGTSGNSFHGRAIGFTVLMGAYSVSKVSSRSRHTARLYGYGGE